MVFLETIQPQPQPPDRRTLNKLILVASIAAGVQFGWALQLSHLTPYTQLLGLSHEWVSFIWLCGPISGLIVQPVVGHYSDHCTSCFGRRRPFLVSGTILLSIGVCLTGFAADIGIALGDSLEERVKIRAVTIFVLGFWLLDFSNNMIQGPCRALLADIAGDNDAMVTIGNALFAFFMAIGNMMGYAAGASEDLHRVFPFTYTKACDHNCANLKSCLLLGVVLMTCIVFLVVIHINEERSDRCYLVSFHTEERPPSFFMQIVIAGRSTSRPIRILYTVTALNWIGLFPFLLYVTDWMGKEVYGGNVWGDQEQLYMYNEGVRAGSLGLLFYVVTMGIVSLFMEPLTRILGNIRRLWSAGNFVLAGCMGLTVVISVMSQNARKNAADKETYSPPLEVNLSCFALFGLLGFPQAVTYSIPFALASIYSKDSGMGQGLALGLLNLAIVIPQCGAALISGPLDLLFGRSNLPAFVWGGIAAAMGGVAALRLPLTD